jgi:hypothetical protein
MVSGTLSGRVSWRVSGSGLGVYPGTGRFQGMGNSSLSRVPPEVRNSCVREYPKVRYPVHVPGKPGTRPSGSAPDACPGAVRDAVRDVSGRGFGSVLGTSWKCLPERPEVPSGASGSAFRTPKRLRKAENGRLGRFGLYPGRSTIDD